MFTYACRNDKIKLPDAAAMEENGMKYFNTEGPCRPGEHYMVRLDGRLAYVEKMLIGRKKYFVINRGRQL